MDFCLGLEILQPLLGSSSNAKQMPAVREPGSVPTAIQDFQTKVNPSTPRSDPHVSSPRNINALSNR